ncbi:MAG TPA: hypothetical protein VGE40_14690 [Bacilli bacterium]
MTKNKKGFSLSLGWIFAVIMIAFISLVVLNMISKSKDMSGEELKPGSEVHPHVFSYAPDGETVWLGTHLGVYEYKDSKWKRTLSPLSKDDVMGLEIDPSGLDKISVSGHGYVKQSQNGGKTWKSIEEGLPNTPDAHHLTMDNKNPNHLFTMLAHQRDNLYETSDGGNTWVVLGTIQLGIITIAAAPDNSSSLLAGSETGLFRYDLINGSLKETKISNEPTLQVITLDNGDVIAMNEGGFVRSSDLKTWTPIGIDLNGEMPFGIKASKKDPNRLVIITQNLSVYESKNGGLDWTKL